MMESERKAYPRRWLIALPLILASLAESSAQSSSGPVRAFTIPFGDMSPTLRIGDTLHADLGAYDREKIARGDIVAFKVGSPPTINYTKRIIGLPGDRIQMRDGVIILNGKAVQQQAAGTFTLPSGSGTGARDVKRVIETLPGGREYYVLNLMDGAPFDDTKVITVPSNSYFVMGDNRDDSNDSRVIGGGIGMVSRKRIIGRMSLIYSARDKSRIGQRVDQHKISR